MANDDEREDGPRGPDHAASGKGDSGPSDEELRRRYGPDAPNADDQRNEDDDDDDDDLNENYISALDVPHIEPSAEPPTNVKPRVRLGATPESAPQPRRPSPTPSQATPTPRPQETTSGSSSAPRRPTERPAAEPSRPATPPKRPVTPPPVLRATRPADEPDPSLDADADSSAPVAPSRGTAHRLGILGGRKVGKSYLMRSIVYRCHASDTGALDYFLRDAKPRLERSFDGNNFRPYNLEHFVKLYTAWERLPATQQTQKEWYRLNVTYGAGLFGLSRKSFELDFFDASGEGFFQNMSADSQELWRETFLRNRVIAFCLPLWVAFPGANMTEEDWEDRNATIEDFGSVLQNYESMRLDDGAKHKVQTILILTMADDRRSRLDSLRENWIAPCIDNPDRYVDQVSSASGVANYLKQALEVSNRLLAAFADERRDARIGGIPRRLDFGGGLPWVIPVSAIEGTTLDRFESNAAEASNAASSRYLVGAPQPAHVELPVLVALCSGENALM